MPTSLFPPNCTVKAALALLGTKFATTGTRVLFKLKVFFGWRRGCDVRLVAAQVANGGLGVQVVLEKERVTVKFVIPSPGLHLAINACAAAAVATLLGVSLAQVGISLSKFSPVQMRSELLVSRSGIKIVNDAYNANPISTRAAIDLLKDIACNGKRVVILGDMLELGSTERESHEKILSYCCDACIDLIGLVGDRFRAAAENMNLIKTDYIVVTNDAEILSQKIVKRLKSNDVVLVKGSRAIQMEKVVDVIKAM